MPLRSTQWFQSFSFIRHTSLVLLITLIATLSAFAKNPPKTSGPTPVWDRSGKEESDQQPGLFNGPALPVPPSLYPFLSGAMVPPSILRTHGSRPEADVAPQSIVRQTPARRRSIASQPSTRETFSPGVLNVPSFISTWYNTDASNSTNDESEPSLVALTNSYGTFTAEAYQQDDGHFQLFGIHVATSNDPSAANSFTISTPYIPFNPAPTGYTDAFDPMLATNPYSDGSRPGAVYLTACMGTRNYGGPIPANPMAIRAWGTALGPLQPINDAPGTQIQPAIDNDDTGNVLMTYYTTENHTTDGRYQIYGMGLSSGGQVLPGCGPTSLDGANSYANGFTGDYHDNYYFTFPSALGSLWNTAWARNAGTTQATAFDV